MIPSTIIAGIDPGLGGAIVLLNPVTRAVVFHDMPTVKSKNGKPETDLHRLGLILRITETGRHIALIENVHTMPGQGLSSAFRFGQNFGACQMALAGHGWEMHSVTPQIWKKHFKLPADKKASLQTAVHLFPAYSEQLSRVKDNGRAEALLIALYAAHTIASRT